MSPRTEPPPGLYAVARTLAVDGWTGEAVRALRAAGVDALLLKGPAIASRLYPPDEPRLYVDADLLVSPDRVVAAERVLASLGYALRDPAGERERFVSGPHAQTWARPADDAIVDLHHTVPGDVQAEAVVWSVLWPRSVSLDVAGTPVPVLDDAGLAVLLTLHAWHHGPGVPQPQEDLRRAIATFSVTTWEQATVVAEQLMALPQFAAGLRSLDAGGVLAERVGLPPAAVTEALSADAVAFGFARLAATRGMRARLTLLARRLFPSAGFMHWWRPWSRRSRAALLLCYGYRLGWLVVHVVPGWRAWRRA